MFDRLIESESVHTDLKARRRYFVGSSIIVGLLFLTAVVFSIYAADFDIGEGNFDMSRMIAPVVADAPKPEPPKAAPQPASASNAEVKRPMRTVHIARIDEQQAAPRSVSTVRNTVPARPDGYYDIGPRNIDTGGSAMPRGKGGTGISGTSSSTDGSDHRAASTPRATEPPPPVVKKTPTTTSGGVVNGNAINLPKPPYPQPARMVGAKGNVNIQVMIDEAGKVISAKAVSGHPLLRQVAETAARQATFNPTLLSGKPVKVTGVIVYKFTGN